MHEKNITRGGDHMKEETKVQDTIISSEPELLQKFKVASEKVDELTRELAIAEADEMYYMQLILDVCEAKGVTKTAEYAGIGHATVMRPQVTTASYAINVKDELFKLVRDIKRDDLIKEAIHPTTLRGFIGELLDEIMAKPVPEEEKQKKLGILRLCYYEVNPKARLYSPKKEKPTE